MGVNRTNSYKRLWENCDWSGKMEPWRVHMLGELHSILFEGKSMAGYASQSLYNWAANYYDHCKSWVDAGWNYNDETLEWINTNFRMVIEFDPKLHQINCSPSKLLQWSRSHSIQETINWIAVTNSPQMARRLSSAGVTPAEYVIARKAGLTRDQILKTPDIAKVAGVMAA